MCVIHCDYEDPGNLQLGMFRGLKGIWGGLPCACGASKGAGEGGMLASVCEESNSFPPHLAVCERVAGRRDAGHHMV